MKLTYEIAHAAAWDAGNQNMRVAGRVVWNEEDYQVCREKMVELLAVIDAVER